MFHVIDVNEIDWHFVFSPPHFGATRTLSTQANYPNNAIRERINAKDNFDAICTMYIYNIQRAAIKQVV